VTTRDPPHVRRISPELLEPRPATDLGLKYEHEVVRGTADLDVRYAEVIFLLEDDIERRLVALG